MEKMVHFLIYCGHLFTIPIIVPSHRFVVFGNKKSLIQSGVSEIWVKYSLLITFVLLCLLPIVKGTSQNIFSSLEWIYLIGFVPLEVYVSFVHGWILPTLPFLPLMVISVYCTIGVLYSFLRICCA